MAASQKCADCGSSDPTLGCCSTCENAAERRDAALKAIEWRDVGADTPQNEPVLVRIKGIHHGRGEPYTPVVAQLVPHHSEDRLAWFAADNELEPIQFDPPEEWMARELGVPFPQPLQWCPIPPYETGAVVNRGAEHHKLDTDSQVFFYEQEFYVLSNFSAFKVSWGPYTLDTSEHLYHWRRFFLAGHAAADRMADRILHARSAHEAFKLAQENTHLQIPTWDEIKVGEMGQILRAKSEQHEYVRRKLLATGDRELVEDSWRDDFWGWGPNRDGQNMLGKLWMEVRAELRATLPQHQKAGS